LHSTTPVINGSKWHPHLSRKIIAPEILPLKMAEFRGKNAKIITLNGSFDLLHAGHLKILSHAYDLKDENGVFIVALNTDESVQRYKSVLRPIIPLEERLQMMAASVFVDYVTWFGEDDPIELLKVIRPDIHVNGSEYGENCIEAKTVQEGGGVISIVEKAQGLSTSTIIKKILAFGEADG